jgi:hypothetical protein
MVGMTWREDTYSLIGNPDHPCMHADPFFPDLGAGQETRIQGDLLFFEGSLEAFEEWFRQRNGGGEQDAPADVDEPRRWALR